LTLILFSSWTGVFSLPKDQDQVWNPPNLQSNQSNDTEIFAFLHYYAMYCNSLQAFRDNLLVPSSRVKKSKKKAYSIWW